MGKRKSKSNTIVMEVSNSSIPIVLANIGENGGFDRQAVISATTTEGTPIATATMTVIQPGLRQEFIPADSSEGMQDANGEFFGVLK